MDKVVGFSGDEGKIQLSIVERAVVEVMNNEPVRAMGDLSVHVNQEFFSGSSFFTYGIELVLCSFEVPLVGGDPIVIFRVDKTRLSLDDDNAIVKDECRLYVEFDQHKQGLIL